MDLSALLINKMKTQEIILELTKVLGQGGESIVLEKTINFQLDFKRFVVPKKIYAIKIVPIKRDAKRIQAKTATSIFGVKTAPIIDSTEAYEEDKPNELTAKDLTHPNIIVFLDSAYEVIDDNVYHLTCKYGKFNFNLLIICLSNG